MREGGDCARLRPLRVGEGRSVHETWNDQDTSLEGSATGTKGSLQVYSREEKTGVREPDLKLINGRSTKETWKQEKNAEEKKMQQL